MVVGLSKDDEDVEGSEAALASGLVRVLGLAALALPALVAAALSTGAAGAGKPEKGGKNLNFEPGLGGTGLASTGTTKGTKSFGGMYFSATRGTGMKPTKLFPVRSSDKLAGV